MGARKGQNNFQDHQRKASDQGALRVARALKEVTQCDKLNIAALGNVVPQLHVHIIARRRGDAAWPRPVWGAMPPKPYDPQDMQQLIDALRRKGWIEQPDLSTS